MVFNFEPIREVVSQGLFMLWAALVVHVYPALTMSAIRPACIRADVTCFMPFAHFDKWVIENGELLDFVVARFGCMWGGHFVWRANGGVDG